MCLWAIFYIPRIGPHISYSRIGADRSWEYITRSQTHECGNSDCGRTIPFLRIFVLNFRYWFFGVITRHKTHSAFCNFCFSRSDAHWVELIPVHIRVAHPKTRDFDALLRRNGSASKILNWEAHVRIRNAQGAKLCGFHNFRRIFLGVQMCIHRICTYKLKLYTIT